MFTQLTFGFALLAAIIIGRVMGEPVRILAFLTLASAAVYTGFAPLWGGVLIALAPVFIKLLTLLYYICLGRLALAGKMGKEQKWVAELVKANDEKFMESMDELSQMKMKEIFVIADTKEEMRQLVIERASEDKS